MDRKAAIEKIKKCLARAASDNPNEAATAMRQAQALMREHSVDQEGIQLASVCEVDMRAKLMPIVQWETNLASMVAQAFGCEVITVNKYGLEAGLFDPARRLRYWRIVGVDAAPEIAGYTLEVLGGQCARARLTHVRKQSRNCKPMTKAARGDAFALGWVRGVRDLVDRFASGDRDEALIAAYLAKNYPDLVAARVQRRDVGRNVKDDAFHWRRAAESATLHHGVGSPLERKLIGA